MIRIRVDPERPEPALVERAARVLRDGGLVAFPTETVYGLGANALDEAAVRRVFQAKGRPAYNPVIVHVAEATSARSLVTGWPESAQRLADAFWPGPLTLILEKSDRVPDMVTGGLAQVAVRVPAHPVALALLRAAGVPVVAPSANPSMAVSPTSADHVEKGLGQSVDVILDAGATRLGIESTVLDLSGSAPRLLRPGALSVDDLAAIIGPIRTVQDAPSARRYASPGMLERHYAPRARVRLFESRQRQRAAGWALRARGAGHRVGALLLDPLDAPVDHPIRMPTDPAGYAQRLYAELHRLDDLACDIILVEQVPDGAAWAGVRDRLARASTPETEWGD
jgi:L-threonylcarbamoyladenylate synthase